MDARLLSELREREKQVYELAAIIATQEEVITRLREALKPFAKFGRHVSNLGFYDHEHLVRVGTTDGQVIITYGDLRRAAVVIHEETKD